MRALWSLGFVVRVLELVVGAVEGGVFLAEQRDQYLNGLLEAIQALLNGAELDAAGVGLLDIAAGADSEFESPIGDDVQCGTHIGQYGGVSVVDAGHHRAQP